MIPRIAIACIVFSIASANAKADPMSITTKDGVTQIENVSVLIWDKSGQTTFCGALHATATAMGIKTSYVDLMGDSALAFRSRWWRGDTASDKGWCPSSPVGEFSPWDRRAADSIGLSLDYHVHLDGKTDMATYAAQIKASIDDGRPVLVYGETLDLGVVYGYADDGRQILARDYFKGDVPVSMPLSKTKGMVVFVEKTNKPIPSPHDRAIAAMKAAVADWRHGPEPMHTGSGRGHYLFGDAAYEEWIDNVRGADKLTEAERKQLFSPSWWTLCVLADARQAAAAYLKRVGPLFEGDARAAIDRAADLYAQSASAASKTFVDKAVFLGPWTGKTIADWSAEVSAKEADVLRTLRKLDGAAIAELEKAVR